MTASGPCPVTIPADWTLRYSQYYKTFKVEKTFADAQTECTNEHPNMKLAEYRTPEEYFALRHETTQQGTLEISKYITITCS